MNVFRIILSLVLVAIAGAVIYNWQHSFFTGNFTSIMPMHVILGSLLIPIITSVAVIVIGNWIWKKDSFTGLFSLMPIALVPMLMLGSCSGCRDYSKANQIVVYSEDCGSNWKSVKAGDAIPVAGMNRCFQKEIMPSARMTGDVKFSVKFSGNVKVDLTINYSYGISDPILFMQNARQLGATNVSQDDPSYDIQRFESAENTIIDVNIKKSLSDSLVTENVVKHDANVLEELFLVKINEILKTRGVKIYTFEMYPDFQPMTEMAIDAANAMSIYEANGMKEIGMQIILAKAGANQTNIYQGGSSQGQPDSGKEKK